MRVTIEHTKVDGRPDRRRVTVENCVVTIAQAIDLVVACLKAIDFNKDTIVDGFYGWLEQNDESYFADEIE